MDNMKELAAQVMTALKGYVKGVMDPVIKRIELLEAKSPVKGDKGDRGEPGERGEKGEVGSPGKPGDKGEKGDTGEQGAQGIAGKDGEPGKQGEKGDQGQQGERGLTGERGAEGLAGSQGSQGEAGSKGERGEKGETGERGETGPAGKDGADGLVGKDGQPGQRGEQGDRGEKGDTGERGEPGLAGKDGADGINGKDGLAGKDAVVDPEVVRAVAAEILPGMVEKAQAVLAERIDAMRPELQGKDGAPGKDGEAGISGKDGEAGRDGRDGRDGKDGLPGRDAAELDVLSGIDENKSYRAGTWAQHNGGEIRAMRQTDPIKDGNIEEAGWRVMRDGVSAIVVHQNPDNEREFTVSTLLTSGLRAETKVKMPVVIYRETWKEGTAYERGDMVTWGGSIWHCQKDTTDKPGADPTTWKLAVKEGARGKDAQGISGPSSPVRVKP